MDIPALLNFVNIQGLEILAHDSTEGAQELNHFLDYQVRWADLDIRFGVHLL